jgi:hypothetical protein
VGASSACFEDLLPFEEVASSPTFTLRIWSTRSV